jgi:hypothetical protein
MEWMYTLAGWSVPQFGHRLDEKCGSLVGEKRLPIRPGAGKGLRGTWKVLVLADDSNGTRSTGRQADEPNPPPAPNPHHAEVQG